MESGEECDDGNEVSGDACSATCTVEICGNGIRDIDEICDDGNEVSGDGCSADCQRIETCGNGMREFGEVCDDGNMVSGDGCSPDCISREVCGNAYADFDEDCDDGEDTMLCDADCTIPACGDGFVNPEFTSPDTGFPEQCDEDRDGDGVADNTATCDETPGWLGAITRLEEGRLMVTEVRRETPAHIAGINVGDEILAIGEQRVPATGLDELMRYFAAGSEVAILVARRGRLRRVPVVLGEAPVVNWTLELDPDASRQQRTRRARWLTGT